MPRQGGCKSSVRLKLYEANYLARAAPRMVVILERCIRVTHFEELPAITTHAERATEHCKKKVICLWVGLFSQVLKFSTGFVQKIEKIPI